MMPLADAPVDLATTRRAFWRCGAIDEWRLREEDTRS